MSSSNRVLLALLASLVALPAAAIPAPPLPLPPCEDSDGDETGACPKTDPMVLGNGVGRLSTNSSIGIYVDPQIPPCNTWDANGTGNWSPTPCYRRVFPIEIVGCSVRGITDDSFYDGDCSRLLYESGTGGVGNLFKIGKGESGSCGGEGDFWVYYYGGPGSDPNAIWSARGPTTTNCEIDFLGPEPDGLYGPTWVRLKAEIEVLTGPTAYDSGTRRTTEFYVPIDGQLRDLGPIAAFGVVSNEAGKVSFRNDSVHTRGEPMTYRWELGDGKTSTAEDPENQYDATGNYRVKLTARDATGDENTVSINVQVRFELVVDVTYEPEIPQVGEPFTVTVEVRNPFDIPAERLTLIGPFGLRFDPALMLQESGPEPTAPTSLGGKDTATFTFEMVPLSSGRSTIEGGVQAWIGDGNVSATDSVTVLVPARLDVEVTSSVDTTTKVGDTFTVTATITNNEDVEVTNIESEPLSHVPAEIVTYVSGPIDPSGADPRVSPITLAPGASTTLTWTYEAAQKGATDLKALVSARDPHTESLFYVSDIKRIAIESGAFDITNIRLAPGTPIPGLFVKLTATVTNIGTLDITDIDFELETTPENWVVEALIDLLPEANKPRIASLAPDEDRDIIIPIQIDNEIGGLGSYNIALKMKGKVELDGEPTEIEYTARIAGSLDLVDYHTTIFERVRQGLIDETLAFFEGVNDFGESSTLGGVMVGSGQGVLNALQTVGDGLITTGELAVNTVTGKYELTAKGQAIAQCVVEYYHTTSPRQIARDFADAGYALAGGVGSAALDGVGTMADWMRQVDKAYTEGDARKVAELIAEPVATVLLAVGGEVAVQKAGAAIWTKHIQSRIPRKKLPDLRNTEVPDVDLGELRDLAKKDLADLPTGVAIADEVAIAGGLAKKDLDWMRKMAKEHGVAFFARPRPAEAAAYAARGYNAKPMAIKFKSVSDVDVDWLGYDDYAGKKGLVVLRKPKNPRDALRKAVEEGKLPPDSAEAKKVMARYEERLAEFDATKEKLDKLNAGDGFDIKVNGKTVKTKATIDSDGLLRFSHNGQPVYSDIDLLHIAKPDGTHINPLVHEDIIRAAGEGFDIQHGDTMSSSDFKDWDQAKGFIKRYGEEHMRGGEPLIIIGPDATTLGYVKSMSIPDTIPNGELGGYNGFGKVTVEYEGAYIK